MAFRAKILNREKVMARLQAMVPEAEKNLAIAQMESGKLLADRIKPRAPVQSGRYRNSIHAAKISDMPGAQGSLVGIKATKDKNAVGIFALFVWRFLEFGTVRQRAQPHIFPTYRAARKSIRRMMANAVNKVVRAEQKRQGQSRGFY